MAETRDALLLEDTDEGRSAEVRKVSVDRFRSQHPEADVRVRVAYSSLNYKDALAVTGRGRVVRGELPFVPGIDLAGTVIESAHPAYEPGDRVLQTGGWLGEKVWGGMAEEARVRGDWLVALPEKLGLREAMQLGTAGFTAMLAIEALEEHAIGPDDGELLVTGASGGVGICSVALLDRLGYQVVASSGREEAYPLLEELGADRIVDRASVGGGAERPLESARWAGAVDAVGGATLARVLAQTARHGAVAACGNAGGAELSTTVYPFILRGVRLLGIDSNTYPPEERPRVWERLRDLLDPSVLGRICPREIPLEEVPAASRQMLEEGMLGRTLVRIAGDS